MHVTMHQLDYVLPCVDYVYYMHQYLMYILKYYILNHRLLYNYREVCDSTYIL